uniref:(northern house mosquito) hypothetical protein n=1 Tax=Culex pipiens TaxID=7175 RepID=A0A8D8KWR1_CULPI
MNGSPRAPQWRWLKLLHSPDADRNLLGGQGCDRVTLQAALVPVVADFSSSSAARARSLRSIPLTVAAMVTMTRTRLGSILKLSSFAFLLRGTVILPSLAVCVCLCLSVCLGVLHLLFKCRHFFTALLLPLLLAGSCGALHVARTKSRFH